MKRSDKKFDLRESVYAVWTLQKKRIVKAAKEERRRWFAAKPGERELDSHLSDELALGAKLLACLFEISGKSPELQLHDHDHDQIDESSLADQAQIKKLNKNLYNIIREERF